jgi:hypothetical protein
MAEVKRQKYVCIECKATDEVKLFLNEPTPPAINCWSCKSGRRADMNQMLSQGLGMRPAT